MFSFSNGLKRAGANLIKPHENIKRGGAGRALNVKRNNTSASIIKVKKKKIDRNV